MPEKVNKDLLQKYDLYVAVREGKKTIKSQTIILHDDPNHHTGKERIEKAEHPSVSHLEFAINSHKTEKQRYAFKLSSKEICAKPFFRFDAAGATHRNKSPETPLALQVVTTPHFQFYDKHGYSIAYKTEDLKNSEKLEQIDSNINEGVKLFCSESNTFVENGDFPEIVSDTELIPYEKKDPLADINF
jgi:hypothetical protein